MACIASLASFLNGVTTAFENSQTHRQLANNKQQQNISDVKTQLGGEGRRNPAIASSVNIPLVQDFFHQQLLAFYEPPMSPPISAVWGETHGFLTSTESQRKKNERLIYCLHSIWSKTVQIKGPKDYNHISSRTSISNSSLIYSWSNNWNQSNSQYQL